MEKVEILGQGGIDFWKNSKCLVVHLLWLMILILSEFEQIGLIDFALPLCLHNKNNKANFDQLHTARNVFNHNFWLRNILNKYFRSELIALSIIFKNTKYIYTGEIVNNFCYEVKLKIFTKLMSTKTWSNYVKSK